ncbi:MAG: cytosine permease [bacterium]
MSTDSPTVQIEQTSDDFCRAQVPDNQTFSGWHIALVIIGGVIGIPSFMQASHIGGELGLMQALVVFSVGSLILGILGGLTSYTGAKTRYSTYLLTEFSFGPNGAKLVNLAIATSLIGWYAVIINVFADAARLSVQSTIDVTLPHWAFVLGGSGLMLWVTLSGFKGIEKLAHYMVPLMLLFLGYAAYASFGDIESFGAPQSKTALSHSAAISAVVGGYISGVVIQPDYSRFATNARHAVWAAVVSLWLVQGAVFVLAAIPSVATGEADLIKIMISLGIGVPAFLLLLMSSWCSNVLCLYSSSLSVSTISQKWPLKTIILLAGIFGTILAFVYSPDFFINFLLILGIGIPSIASIYVMEVLVIRRCQCDTNQLTDEAPINFRAFVVWILSAFVGYLSVNGVFHLTGASSLDTILSAVLFFLILNLDRLKQEKRIIREHPAE